MHIPLYSFVVPLVVVYNHDDYKDTKEYKNIVICFINKVAYYQVYKSFLKARL